MDPFSLTTGIAGFVSLGLTICDGIITYCRNYQSRIRDVESLSQHAEQLRTFLHLFGDRATRNSPVEDGLRIAVEKSLNACTVCLYEVENLASKHSLSSQRSNGLQLHSRFLMQSLKYPFQRDELQAFREQLNNLRPTLYGYQLLLTQYVAL